VVGDVMLDRYWYGDASRIRPKHRAGAAVQGGGIQAGRAANVAANCVKLGARTLLLSWWEGMKRASAGEAAEKGSVDAKLQHDRRFTRRRSCA